MQTIAMAVGILATLGTWLVNWWYKRKEDRRAAEEHEWRRQQRLGVDCYGRALDPKPPRP